MAPAADDADKRWRDVLFELLRRAELDSEFRARVEATGAIITDLEGVLARRSIAGATTTGTLACREYWWGFQLELPHEVLARWSREATDAPEIAAQIEGSIGPAAPFRRRLAAWIASRLLPDLHELDHGAGIYACMLWMAPNIFVPLPIPVAKRR